MACWEWDSFPLEQPINNFYYKSYTDINMDSFSSIQCITVEYLKFSGPHVEDVEPLSARSS